MSLLSNPAFGPRVALIYVTVGMLLDVWTGVYYFYNVRGNPEATSSHFWVTGLFLTGLTLIFLGLVLGPLGQYARKAELPPEEAQHRELAVQQTAAAHPNPVVPGGAVPGAMMPPAGVMPPGYPPPGAAAGQVTNVPYTAPPVQSV